MKKFNHLLAIFIILLLYACADKNVTNPDDNNEDKLGITRISPDQGYAGTIITVDGNMFGIAKGSSVLKFGKETIPDTDIQIWENKQIQFRTPETAAVGNHNISVIVDGAESNSLTFELLPKTATAPVIDALSKNTATEGETVKIIGSNFGTVQNSSYVEVSGVKSESYLRWLDNEIIATVPYGATSGKIVVWVNKMPSNSKFLNIQAKFKLLTMVTIPSGSFQMGGKQPTETDNKPIHTVNITKSFEMSVSEITQKEWKTVMDGSNPSQVTDTGDFKPVQQVTFKRAIEFCNRLSLLEELPVAYQINGDDITLIPNSKGYRLPTEAEWEYACRAGNTNEFTNEEILELGWVAENAGGKIHDVKSKKKNVFGLFDMLGNVAEWCWDEYSDDYYSKSPANDPTGPVTEFKDRIIRGASIFNSLIKCNSSLRNSFPGRNDNYNYDLGFRVVRNK